MSAYPDFLAGTEGLGDAGEGVVYLAVGLGTFWVTPDAARAFAEDLRVWAARADLLTPYRADGTLAPAAKAHRQ